MTPTELKTLFRAEVRDEATPYLWSDVEVWAFMNDALQMFCRRTDGISDGTTTAVTQISVAEGATWLNLHASILKIRGATRTSDGCELTVLNYEDLADRGIKFDGTEGEVKTIITGMEENKLRLAQVASAADTIQLLVFRLPLVEITAATVAGATAILTEIGVQHHQHLLPWMKHLAYSKQDAETLDPKLAETFAAEFNAYCAQAKREQGMKRHKAGRTVRYGGYYL